MAIRLIDDVPVPSLQMETRTPKTTRSRRADTIGQHFPTFLSTVEPPKIFFVSCGTSPYEHVYRPQKVDSGKPSSHPRCGGSVTIPHKHRLSTTKY
jgi:hypothetical protein